MNVLGSKNNPYYYSQYQDMRRANVWTGGWVRQHDNTIAYITTNGNVEENRYDSILGSEDNPFTNEAYNEMISKHIWDGGYVIHGSELIFHPGSEDDAEGCGCGCGEGCGCGSGYTNLTAGSEWVTDPNVNITGHPGTNPELLIEWGEGSFVGETTPFVSAKITDRGNASENAIPISASWSQPFIVYIMDSRLSGNIYYSIPQQYRS